MTKLKYHELILYLGIKKRCPGYTISITCQDDPSFPDGVVNINAKDKTIILIIPTNTDTDKAQRILRILAP